ncbi:MAG: ATP-binding protein [Rhodocyclaceae bacterium]|nr:ATP-binding protein [Rhodocyclaceae bacterium]
MSDWLSSTWEASWRPFQYFNFYRLLLAGLVLLAALLPESQISTFHLVSVSGSFLVILVYVCLVFGGLILSIYWQRRFNIQLTVQVFADVFFVSLLMFSLGGVSSGMGTLLLVSLASASLVGRGRLVLFYAAVATLATLLVQVFGILAHNFDAGSVVQAGFLSAGFFATAILARMLGQRVMINEELARQRGESLENQSRISQRVVERMQDGVLVVDREARVQRCNPMAEAMLGSLPVGANLAVHAPELTDVLTGQKLLGRQFEISGVDGQRLQARIEETASTSGEILIFIEDVGRIREQAQQLKLASLGRLTASIAHEIRNPLSAIGHAGELLREERRGVMQDRLLNILADNVARLDRIVADVLELGRRERTQQEMLSLQEACEQFMDNFLVSEGLDTRILELDVANDLYVCFDRAHLHQVLWNLVGNAVRYSQGKPSSVRIYARAGANRERVELHVLDDGAGIPEAVKEQIFEPFFTTHHKGTGLGLFIARELCEANAASLELLPNNKGGHFVISGRAESCR